MEQYTIQTQVARCIKQTKFTMRKSPARMCPKTHKLIQFYYQCEGSHKISYPLVSSSKIYKRRHINIRYKVFMYLLLCRCMYSYMKVVMLQKLIACYNFIVAAYVNKGTICKSRENCLLNHYTKNN